MKDQSYLSMALNEIVHCNDLIDIVKTFRDKNKIRMLVSHLFINFKNSEKNLLGNRDVFIFV
jgi:hypothetical protein